MTDKAAIRKLVLERLRLRTSLPFTVDMIEDYVGGPASFAELVADEVLMQFETQLAANHRWSNESGWEIVPVTWWDSFKLNVLPRWPLGDWLLERFPARTRAIVVEVHNYRVCPHIGVPERKDCLKWLEGVDG